MGDYRLDKWVIFGISPPGTALLLGTLALLLAARRRPRMAGVLALVGMLWLYAASTPQVSHAMRGALERAHPYVAPQQLPRVDVVVVLGGGIEPPSPGHPRPELHAATDRVWFGAQLYRAGRAPRVLLSGGADPQRYTASEAAAMRELMLDLGVPAEAIVLEERSRNTRENARFSAPLLRERGASRILLVTSALHMPRALPLFQAQGLQVVPAPTDHEARDVSGWPAAQRWLPSVDALQGSTNAIKEWVGRLAQRT